MNYEDVIDAFAQQEEGKQKDLVSEGDKLFIGSTCVAEWDAPVCYVNNSIYCDDIVLFRRILDKLIFVLESNDVDIFYVDNAPMGNSGIKVLYDKDRFYSEG